MDQKQTSSLNLLALRRQYTDPHELYNAMREQHGLYFDKISNHVVFETQL